MEKKMETLGPLKRVYRGHIGVIGLFWDSIGIMEKKMETAIENWGYMENYAGATARVNNATRHFYLV